MAPQPADGGGAVDRRAHDRGRRRRGRSTSARPSRRRTGRCLPLLAATGARLVVGVDLSLPMLEPKQSFRAPRLCADACRLPFRNGAFDLVSSSLMVGDVDDLRGWITEAARVLARGGNLVYSDFHPSWATEGWRRTFRTADGRLMELGFHPHGIEEHLAALEARSYSRIRERARPVARLLPAGRRPVVVVFHAVKRGR